MSYRCAGATARGQQPSTSFSAAVGTKHGVTFNYPGELDTYSPNYGQWYSSQVIPLNSDGSFDFCNHGTNAGDTGYVFISIRGYSIPTQTPLANVNNGAQLIIWQYLITPFYLELQVTTLATYTMAVTGVPFGTRYILADVFITESAQDQTVWWIGRGTSYGGQYWVRRANRHFGRKGSTACRLAGSRQLDDLLTSFVSLPLALLSLLHSQVNTRGSNPVGAFTAYTKHGVFLDFVGDLDGLYLQHGAATGGRKQHSRRRGVSVLAHASFCCRGSHVWCAVAVVSRIPRVRRLLAVLRRMVRKTSTLGSDLRQRTENLRSAACLHHSLLLSSCCPSLLFLSRYSSQWIPLNAGQASGEKEESAVS
jgi:hypothetical protein